MTTTTYKRVPPDVTRLLCELKNHDVMFLLAGSVAAEAWGADVPTPADLDIVPATDRENLERLARALRDIEATSWPVSGQWVTEASGEVSWKEFAEDDPRRGQRLPIPDPNDVSTFDSLFSTNHGELDIVPLISGSYATSIGAASSLTVRGVEDVQVMSISDLLVHLTVPRRKKDADRVRALRQIQHRLKVKTSQ